MYEILIGLPKPEALEQLDALAQPFLDALDAKRQETPDPDDVDAQWEVFRADGEYEQLTIAVARVKTQLANLNASDLDLVSINISGNHARLNEQDAVTEHFYVGLTRRS